MNRLFFIAHLFSSGLSFAQLTPEETNQVDSLKKIISSTKNDTIRINAYLEWDNVIYISDVELDFEINQKISNICKKNLRKNISVKENKFYNKNLAQTHQIMGNYYEQTGNYDSATIHYNSALSIRKKLNDKKGIADSYGGLAIVLHKQGSMAEAINYNLIALKLYEETGNKRGVASTYLNIGIVNRSQNNFDEAIKNYKNAIKIQKEINDLFGMSNALNNLGTIYTLKGNYDLALDFHNQAMDIRIKNQDKYGIASSCMNIGNVYQYQCHEYRLKKDEIKEEEKFNAALLQYKKALALNEENHDQEGVAMSYLNMGSLYFENSGFEDARKNLMSGLSISTEINNESVLRESYHFLSTLDSIQGNYKGAYFNYHHYIRFRDSLINDENTKKIIQQQMQYNFNKTQAEDSVAFAKEKEIDEIEIAKQDAELNAKRNQQYLLFGGLGLVLIFTFFIYNRFRVTKKQKIIIEQKEKETQHQKEIIEEKQKEIIDSINYAKRLQQAILAPESEIKKHFPESFLLYLPKDIVAGDFYFFETTDTHIFYAAADCTGHGVPGALVSVVCSNALSRCVKEFKLADPGKILDKTRELVLDTFKKSGENVKDGMDISFISINRVTKEIKWAGANNPLWIVTGLESLESDESLNTPFSQLSQLANFHNLQLTEIKPDKQPIGKTDAPVPFTTHDVNAKEGNLIFLFTDGYADQFGGPKGKKFKYSQLQKLLLENSTKQLSTFNLQLSTSFSQWKGELEQVDDVCVIGIRI